MRKDHELRIGGALMAADLPELAAELHWAGARYMTKGPTSYVLKNDKYAGAFIRSRLSPDTRFRLLADRVITKDLRRWLEDKSLDYRYRAEDYLVLFDARRNRGTRFHQHEDKILLALPEAQDPARRGEAASWSSWAPRPLSICTSKHQFLGKKFA